MMLTTKTANRLQGKIVASVFVHEGFKERLRPMIHPVTSIQFTDGSSLVFTAIEGDDDGYVEAQYCPK